MKVYKPVFGRFMAKFISRKIAFIALLFFLCNLWLKPFFSILLLLAVIGYTYQAWSNEKEKYNQLLFLNDAPMEAHGPIFWIAFVIEFLILLVGLHYLYKGFTIVTGISEAWFNVKTTGKISSVGLSVSFIMAAATIMTMMWLLNLIVKSNKNGRLIFAYVALDIIILMPFNFMFAYENNQRETLVLFYANSLPKLHDKIAKEVNKLKEASDNKFDSVTLYNSTLNSRIKDLQEQSKSEVERYSKTNQSNMDVDARSDWQHQHSKNLRRINDTISSLQRRLNPNEINIRINKNHYDTIYAAFVMTGPVVKGILSGSIEKERLADSVFYAKQIFSKLAESDTIFKKDTVADYYVECLQVSPEAPVAGFTNLINDLVGWAFKNKPIEVHESKEVDNKAQATWNASLGAKRWFSFLFSVSIDLIPLIVALCYVYFFRQEYKFVNE